MSEKSICIPTGREEPIRLFFTEDPPRWMRIIPGWRQREGCVACWQLGDHPSEIRFLREGESIVMGAYNLKVSYRGKGRVHPFSFSPVYDQVTSRARIVHD